MFAPPFVGLKWVELNGVLLLGNPASTIRTPGWLHRRPTNTSSAASTGRGRATPARNGLCRGGLRGDRGLRTPAQSQPGPPLLARSAGAGHRAEACLHIAVDGQTVAQDWTVWPTAPPTACSASVTPAENIALQFTPAPLRRRPDSAITAVALTDTTDASGSKIRSLAACRPASLTSPRTAPAAARTPQAGRRGKGDQAGIDGDPTPIDETDGAKLYRYASPSATGKDRCPRADGWAQHDFAPRTLKCSATPGREESRERSIRE